jgi:uncharacterized membrane protein YdjX (TVP38/TMEM64 family)
MSARATKRFLFFLVFLAVTGVFALLRASAGVPLTPEAVRDAIRSWGPLAPVVFTAAFVLRPFIFFPSTLLFLAGGLAFGVAHGTLYAATGATAGAVIGFSLARALGREFVCAQLGDRLPDLSRGRWGTGVVLLLNLIPVVPMTAINYGAGLSEMELGPFTLAVAAGLTPRAFAYSFFGDSLLDIGSKEFVLALGLLLALLVIPLIVRRQVSKRACRASVTGPA